MKKLKEKWLVFREKHAKGLSIFNKSLNVFLVVLVTLIVGLFAVGAVKGCSDELIKSSDKQSSERLVDTDIKSAYAVASNYDYFTFNSQLLPSNQSWSKSGQLFKLSVNGFGNYTKVTSSNFASDKSLQSPFALIKPSDASYYSNDYNYYFGVQLFTINVDVNSKLMSVTNSNNLGGTLTFNMSVGVGSTSPVQVLANCPQFYQFTRDGSAGGYEYIQSIQSITFKFSKIPTQDFFLGFYALAMPLESTAQTLGEDMFDILDSLTLAELNSALYSNQKYVFYGSENDYDYGYNNGYGSGYNDGKNDGVIEGENNTKDYWYHKGYIEGQKVDSSKNTLQGLFLTAFQAPFHMFQQAFDVEILGLNLGGLFTGLIVLLVMGFIIKRFI